MMKWIVNGCLLWLSKKKMDNKFDDLFILDLANNHQGDVGHAKTIIKEISEVVIGTGVTCTDDGDCETGETCQRSQEDCNSNGIGDVCECYANLDDDLEIGLFDLIVIKTEYGRDDCAQNPCQADIDGDGEVGLLDLIIMKTQYGKSDCPAS